MVLMLFRTSVYAPQCLFANKSGEKEVAAMVGDLNGHFGVSAENDKDKHGGYTSGERNKKKKTVLEFCASMEIKVGNTLFLKNETYLVTYKGYL